MTSDANNLTVGKPEKRAKEALLTDENRAESTRLKALYEQSAHGLSQSAFGDFFGIGSQGTVWQCLNGKGMPISLKAAQGFAAGLKCQISDFSPRLAKLAEGIAHSVSEANGFASVVSGKTAFDAEPGAEEMGNVPTARPVTVVGMARLGDNGFYEEISSIPGAGDGYVMGYYTTDPEAYCLQVRGDSMFPAIKNGWFIVVEPHTRLAQGEYVVLKLHNGKKMVKELLYERPDSLTVVSVNGGIQQTIMREDLLDAQAVGTILPPSKWKPI